MANCDTSLCSSCSRGHEPGLFHNPTPYPGAHKMGSPTNRTESGGAGPESQVDGTKDQGQPSPLVVTRSWVLRIRTESASLSRAGAEARVTVIVHAHPSTPVLSPQGPWTYWMPPPQELGIRAKVGVS